MKINRTINGKTYAFELNAQELYDAFVEQEHKWDLSDIDAYVGHLYTDDEVDALAWEMRRQRNKYDVLSESLGLMKKKILHRNIPVKYKEREFMETLSRAEIQWTIDAIADEIEHLKDWKNNQNQFLAPSDNSYIAYPVSLRCEGLAIVKEKLESVLCQGSKRIAIRSYSYITGLLLLFVHVILNSVVILP